MIETRTSKMNESVLDVLNLKHKIIANNIANVDTPRYKAQVLVFQEELQKQLAKGSRSDIELRRMHQKHLPLQQSSSGVPYQIIQLNNTVMNNNLNNVDIDTEMATLAKNQLAYNIIVDRVSGHYSKMKKLLTDLT